MKLKLLAYLGFLVYLTIVAYVSILMNFNLWMVSLLFFGLPAVWLWAHMSLSLKVLLPVAVSAFGSTVLFESIAYSSGLWYELSTFDARFLGVFPYEILLWNLALQFMIISFYEYFIDDRFLQPLHLKWRSIQITLGLIFVAVIGVLFATILSRTVLPMAFWWLLAIMMVSLSAVMIIAHGNAKQILKKALLTTMLLLPVLFLSEAIGLFSLHWVFADNNHQNYLLTFNIMGEILPIERIIFLAMLPVWLISLYENCLDDRG